MHSLKFLGSLFVLLIVGCATIEKYDIPDLPEGTTFQRYKGQRLVRVKKVEDLRNAFGKADIWGGKVDKGFTEIYFGGFDGKKVSLVVSDQDIETNASVFTRYFPSSTSSASAKSTPNADGSVTTTAQATTHQSSKEWREKLPGNSFEVLLNYPDEREAFLPNVSLKVIDVSEQRLSFQIFIPKKSDQK